jgi:serine/threonine-protein kinase
MSHSDSPLTSPVNTRTNRVYVGNHALDGLQVINGVTNALLPTIPTGPDPGGLLVDEASSRIYVALSHRGGPGPDVTALGTVIDNGTSHPIVLTPVPLGDPGTQPTDVGLDPIHHRIYVAGLGGGRGRRHDAADRTAHGRRSRVLRGDRTRTGQAALRR